MVVNALMFKRFCTGELLQSNNQLVIAFHLLLW